MGLNIKKVFERKRKIMESEVTGKAMGEVQIDQIIGNIESLEASFFKDGNL